MWKEDVMDMKLSRFFEASARVLLSLLIGAIMLAILAGIIYTFYDLRLIFTMEFHGAFKAILIDVLTVLAIVELLRTALAYFTEGRVKVTYIIDTVMVTKHPYYAGGLAAFTTLTIGAAFEAARYARRVSGT